MIGQPLPKLAQTLLASLALLTLASCSAPPQQATYRLTDLEQARQERERGDLQQAEASFAKLAEKGDELAQLEYAETLILRGKHAQAAALLRPRYDKQADSAEVAGVMARALDGGGQPDEAIAAYVRRLKLVPGDSQAALRLTELLVGRGDAALGCEVAQAGLKTAPDHPQLHVALAKAYLARGRVPLALQAAERATVLAPKDTQTWLQLAQVHLMAGELEKAQQALEQCLKLDSQHADALRDLGIALLELGDAAKALPVLRQAVRVAPDSPVAWTALGLARQRQGDLIGAMAALEQAQRLQPNAAQIYISLADVALDLGMPRRAQSEVRRARERLGSQAQPELRSRVERLLLRCIVVSVLADALCRGTRDGAAIQQAAEQEVRDDGLEALAGEIAASGAAATAHIRAAQARCSPSKGLPADPSPSGAKP